ncbi:MAG: type II toxin-antitoxin system VapC family toxin [Nitrospiraceae bacterium]
MKFWDASALIPLCLHERQTASLSKLAQGDEAIAAWWSSPVECWSALARLRREDLLSASEEGQAQAVLRVLMGAWTEVEPSRVVREQAGRVLRLHPLRAADALQLAAALVWCQGDPVHHDFVCLDQRLREAARREGFHILPRG